MQWYPADELCKRVLHSVPADESFDGVTRYLITIYINKIHDIYQRPWFIQGV